MLSGSLVLTFTDLVLPGNAGSESVDVSTGAGCAWTAESNASFLHVLPHSGLGPGSLRFAFDANLEGFARTGTLTVAGHLVTVIQLAATDPAGEFDPSRDVVRFYHTDAIGSVRLITDASGAQVGERLDYLPFGEPWPASASSAETRRFAGKERDSQTGLDYFGARYYLSQTGGFTAIDPVLVINDGLLNPQWWNRYTYGLNNPLRYVDPDGRYVTDCATGDAECNARAADFEEARKRNLKSRYASVRAAARAYGAFGEKNGVSVHFNVSNSGGITDPLKSTPGNPNIDVWLDPALQGLELQRAIAHEGAHIEDFMKFINSGFDQRFNPTFLQTELRAFVVGAFVLRYEIRHTCGFSPCSFSFGPRDTNTIRGFLLNADRYRRSINMRVFPK